MLMPLHSPKARRVRLSHLRRLIPQYLCVTLLLALAIQAHADTHPQVNPHRIEPTGYLKPLDLTSNWLVHTGDNPTFASPILDDSHWTVIDTAKPLSDYGIARTDFLWYRTHVHLPPNPHNLAILLSGFTGSEQVFVNGVLTGPSREFPAGGLTQSNFDLRSPIPDALIAAGDITIAIRAEIKNTYASNFSVRGLHSGSLVLLGDATALGDSTSLYTFRYTVAEIANNSLAALVLLIAIALAITLRTEREYLFLCLYLGASVFLSVYQLWNSTHEIRRSRFYGVETFPLLLMILCGIEFARLILRIPRSRWIVLYEATLVFLFLAYVVLTASLPYGPPNRGWALGFLIVVLIAVAPVNLALPFFALWVWRRKSNFDALLLSVPLLVKAALFYVEFVYVILSLLHLTKANGFSEPQLHVFRLHWSQITDFFFLLALLFFLIARTVRLARSRATLTAEIAAAATVQQLLLARSSHPTPGFLVDSVYLPASNVGGDFFLVTTHPFDGSLIAVVGDVSGKGLTAAMRVAMILGVLRRETSHHPGDILASLNDAIIAEGEGFTTALCVRIFLNGDFILANAGHIPPYIATISSASTVSREFPTPPALPLGLSLGEVYELQKGHFTPNERLVLMSDGVPEARSRTGELYGFDRLPHLTLLPARDIADVAQRFGQEDDITVLTLAVTT